MKAIAPLDYNRRLWMRCWIGAVLFFLYAPLLTLIAFSFNAAERGTVWRGFSTHHYDRVLENAPLLEALGNSLVIALVATVVSTILGTFAAILLWRYRFPAKALAGGIMAMPIVVPEICMGIALLVFFAKIGWPGDLPWPLSLSQIIVAHVTFCFPFVAIIVRSRLASFNRELEEAARDLGATQARVFRDILIPHLRPAMIAGALLAFTLSLDDFVITFFTSGPNTVTFPIKIYSMVRFSVTPEVNAASTLLIVLTIILTLIAMRIQDFAKDAIA